ncbi:MAG: hypothetical protein J6C90_03315 [Clostridia bacterium]|nr:hypothetical protein [Clostridia bacterium]
MRDYLTIAKIVRPHGLKGEVKVRPLIGDGMQMTDFKKVYLGRQNIPSQILSVKSLNGFFALGLDTLTIIDDAEKFRNQYISIDKADYPQLFAELRASDVVGFEVKTTDGELVGVVTKYDDYGSATVITIGHNGMSYQLPLVEDVIWLSDDSTHLVVDRERYMAVRV